MVPRKSFFPGSLELKKTVYHLHLVSLALSETGSMGDLHLLIKDVVALKLHVHFLVQVFFPSLLSKFSLFPLFHHVW